MSSTPGEPVSGKRLYGRTLGRQSVPTWDQLGDVTKSVWEERARRYNNGDPRWWSLVTSNKETHEG